MGKNYRNKQKHSGDFTKYISNYLEEDDQVSIRSESIDSSSSDVNGKTDNISDNELYDEDDNPLNNINQTSNIDLDGLFNSLSALGGKNAQLADLYKTIGKNEKEVEQPLLDHQQKRYYRHAAYETIAKEAESWVPQVVSNDLKERIYYGQSAPATVNPQRLTSTLIPINDFERELMQAEENAKTLQPQNQLNSEILESDFAQNNSINAARKARLHREHMKNKQMNRIKSKNWHKSKRKGKELLQQKLISRVELEDPELAKQMKHEIEIKAAERRLLRKRQAQNKWAKMAIRYGGKEARSLVSKQSQSLGDYEKNIISLAKQNKSDSDSDSDSDFDDSTDSEKSDTECDKSVAGELETKHPKIYNMKFMKRARESSPNDSIDDNEEENGEIDANESDDNAENKLNQLREFIALEINTAKQSKDCTIKDAKNIGKRANIENLITQKAELERIIDKIPVANNDIACEIFTGNDDQLITDSEEDEGDQLQNVGWGRWISKANKCNKPKQESKKRRVRVKVVNDLEKLSKYTVKTLPYPYANCKSFNSTLDRPLGPEWNTAKAHKRLIQPRVEIKVGNIIIPIKKKDLINKRETDSLLRAFGKASRAQRTMARL